MFPDKYDFWHIGTAIVEKSHVFYIKRYMSEQRNGTTFTIGGDMQVNRLGFGAMRITGAGIWGPPADKDQAIQVLRKAVELGVNFIDTADSYGPNISEELIAEALFPYPENLVIGTKGGFLRTGPNQWQIDASPAHLKEALEGSLSRLKLKTIDLYQLHRIDPKVPSAETFEFLKQAQKQGKIRHIGLSEVSIEEIKEASKFFKVVSVQNKYSYEYRKWEKELEYCNEQQIAFIPWNPLNAGNIKDQEVLKKIAERLKSTVQQVALSWLMQHSPNILLIPGTSSIAHLEENMKASTLTFTQTDLQTMELA